MPFTFAHPAIVLPVKGISPRFFSLTGLVIGSMTPDFEYFIRMKILTRYSHTFGGLFWFDIPLGLVLCFLYHQFVRDTLLQNLPHSFQIRLAGFQHFDWNGYFRKNWLVVVTSVFLGAASHLFWDSFTHNHGFFVRRIPFLRTRFELAGLHFQTSEILQHFSTLVGRAFIVFWVVRLPVDRTVKSKPDIRYWVWVLLLSSVITMLRFINAIDYRFYGNIVVTAISAFMIALIVVPLFQKLVFKKLRLVH